PIPMELGSGFVPRFLEEQNRALTFGLSDKAAAALTAVIDALRPTKLSDLVTGGPKGYHEQLEDLRRQGEEFGKTNPTASNIAAATGTIGSMGALGPGSAASVPVTTFGRILQGAKVGGGVGAVSGFGHSNDESIGKDLLDTGIGAGVGAATGGT